MKSFLRVKSSFLDWYENTSRPLPWRETHDPYKIWVSEVFLQQTQAERVVVFYTRMIEQFPTVDDLARCEWEAFFPYFKGLGFYSRGKNMLKTAKIITEEYNGVFPNDPVELQKLPGIGDYTAHAIVSFAYKESVPALDTNLFRVLGRFWDTEGKHADIREKAFEFYKSGDGDILNHALMDLGASYCQAKKVECSACPLKTECQFFIQEKILIPPEKKKSNLTQKKAQEVSIPLIRKGSYYLLEKKRNTITEEKWGFPLFYRDPKKIEEKDHRHFLQSLSQKKWKTDISVRPPFYSDEQIIDKKLYRFRYSRCQILSGEIIETDDLKFVNIDDIKQMHAQGLIEEVYQSDFLERLWKMRNV